LANEKGFSLIEVVVSIGLLSLVFVGVSSVLNYYGSRFTELRSEQELRTDAGGILQSFLTSESCNRQIKQLVGDYPAILHKLDFDFKTVEANGVVTPAVGEFPGRPYGRLEGARLKIQGTPLPGQTVLRARISLDFRRMRTATSAYPLGHPVRTRSTSVFFALDPQGRLTNCLDDQAYKRIEWSERFCTRIEGQWMNTMNCDLTRSDLVRKAGCVALGLGFTGGACVR
jgi:prepilin-type N-terminal cleavage/methylation domain-containing protein